MFLRLNQTDTAPRELAWHEFHNRYAPVIAGFAKRLNAKQHDVDDLIQEVILGFYALSPKFVYDPAKGRFRSYLKRCTLHALIKRTAKDNKYRSLPLDAAMETAEVVDAWDTEWAQQQMRRALEEVRLQYSDNQTFRAFELNVMLDLPVGEVAQRTGMQPNSVHKAKQRVTEALRNKVRELEENEG